MKLTSISSPVQLATTNVITCPTHSIATPSCRRFSVSRFSESRDLGYGARIWFNDSAASGEEVEMTDHSGSRAGRRPNNTGSTSSELKILIRASEYQTLKRFSDEVPPESPLGKSLYDRLRSNGPAPDWPLVQMIVEYCVDDHLQDAELDRVRALWERDASPAAIREQRATERIGELEAARASTLKELLEAQEQLALARDALAEAEDDARRLAEAEPSTRHLEQRIEELEDELRLAQKELAAAQRWLVELRGVEDELREARIDAAASRRRTDELQGQLEEQARTSERLRVDSNELDRVLAVVQERSEVAESLAARTLAAVVLLRLPAVPAGKRGRRVRRAAGDDDGPLDVDLVLNPPSHRILGWLRELFVPFAIGLAPARRALAAQLRASIALRHHDVHSFAADADIGVERIRRFLSGDELPSRATLIDLDESCGLADAGHLLALHVLALQEGLPAADTSAIDRGVRAAARGVPGGRYSTLLTIVGVISVLGLTLGGPFIVNLEAMDQPNVWYGDVPSRYYSGVGGCQSEMSCQAAEQLAGKRFIWTIEGQRKETALRSTAAQVVDDHRIRLSALSGQFLVRPPADRQCRGAKFDVLLTTDTGFLSSFSVDESRPSVDLSTLVLPPGSSLVNIALWRADNRTDCDADIEWHRGVLT